ncbi:MAG: DEAD/DEAH box helicase [Flavobacteriaceae bacterium]
MGFKDLGLSQQIIKSIAELGIEKPTEVQQKVIPLLLEKKTDLFAVAQTGSGKTLAFAAPILEQIQSKKDTQALVLVPTRELAQQVKKVFFKASKYLDKKIFVDAVYGGEKIHIQEERLERPTQILVATPGRLLELLERNALNLINLKYLVLDEADEMINMGFRPDLDRLLKYIPQEKQVWMYSATLPDELRGMVKNYLKRDYEKIELAKQIKINPNINHRYKMVEPSDKFDYILDFIDSQEGNQGIIFVRTRANAQQLAEALQNEDVSAKAIEGDMGQRDRDKVMRSFKNGATQILVATDVAARGIDVDDLAFVLHHQLPEQYVFYPHRSGRTARAGKKGVSLALVSNREKVQLNDISKKYKIEFREQ